jgi:integrase
MPLVQIGKPVANLDLFDDATPASTSVYRDALSAWLTDAGRAGQLQRESSVAVYEHMWSALACWAVENGVRLDNLTAGDLTAYLASRGGADELSARYAWRLLRLVDRVQVHRAHVGGLEPNRSADELLAARPDLRFANAAERDPLPDFLPASQARQLVSFLSAVRPGRTATGHAWQEVRNRASVGLMLGAGITPGEVRALTLADVIIDAGRSKGIPWKLGVAGNGNAPARETPIASWAGQLLRYWLDVRTEQAIPGAMVFPSTKSNGKQWGKVAQYNAAKEVLQAAGIDDVDGGSFRLRHTFALRQLRRGKSAAEVARWLGVSDPPVMARYLRVVSAPVDVV